MGLCVCFFSWHYNNWWLLFHNISTDSAFHQINFMLPKSIKVIRLLPIFRMEIIRNVSFRMNIWSVLLKLPLYFTQTNTNKQIFIQSLADDKCPARLLPFDSKSNSSSFDLGRCFLACFLLFVPAFSPCFRGRVWSKTAFIFVWSNKLAGSHQSQTQIPHRGKASAANVAGKASVQVSSGRFDWCLLCRFCWNFKGISETSQATTKHTKHKHK